MDHVLQKDNFEQHAQTTVTPRCFCTCFREHKHSGHEGALPDAASTSSASGSAAESEAAAKDNPFVN